VVSRRVIRLAVLVIKVAAGPFETRCRPDTLKTASAVTDQSDPFTVELGNVAQGPTDHLGAAQVMLPVILRMTVTGVGQLRCR
jgi:hypothetical protein